MFANRAADEVWLAEGARGVGGVVELDALVEALCLVLLNTGSADSVSDAYAPAC